MGKPTKFVPVYFAPDMDPSWMVNPGVLVDVQNMVPTTRGTLANYVCTASEKHGTVASYASLGVGDYALSARIMRRLAGSGSGTARFFIGTTLKLLEVGSSSITDETRASGGDYLAQDWTWDSFGDTMIACAWVGTTAPGSVPQVSTGAAGTSFADLTGSPPRAGLCVTQKNQLLVANVSDGSTSYADGWMCSGLGNINSWTTIGGAANLATGANNGRLTETNGQITALVVQRDYVVAYKRDAIYIGQYVGNPFGWAWRLVSDQVGQYSPNGTAVVNGLHYFLHNSGVYVFDGSAPRNIGTGVVNRFMASRMGSETNWDSTIQAVVDERNSLIYWFFSTFEGREYISSSTTTGTAHVALVYNYVTNQFGFVSQSWSDLASNGNNRPTPVMATRGEMRDYALAMSSNIRLDAASIWTVGGAYNDIHIRHSRISDSCEGTTNSESRIVTGDIGNDDRHTRLTRVKPALEAGDDNLQSATCYVDSKATKGDYYSGLGVTLSATATSTSSGSAIGIQMRCSFLSFNHAVASGDYLAFDLLPIAGSLTTPVGFRMTFSDASTFDATTTPTALGTAQSVLVNLTSVVGKTLGTSSSIKPMFGTAGATGAHQAIMRNVRITDSGGTLRRRLCLGNETRNVAMLGSATNYTAVQSYPLDSYGTAYTYDTTKRRWDGNKAARWHRARMTFYNQTEIAGLYLEADDAGSE